MTTATIDQDRLAQFDDAMAEAGLAAERDAPLAPFTTLRVGGPADRLAVAGSIDELVALHRIAGRAGLPVFLLGKGSDLVVADAGIRGLVIRVRADDVRIEGTHVHAEAGTSMTGLAKRCAREGLAGFDWGISIPGSLGGAVWANAGAHDGEMADVVMSVEVYDPRDGERRRLAAIDCAFAYRESRFKHTPEVILGASLELRRGDPAAISALVDAHQAKRRATQPLADQNAGSVFRNPPGDHAGRLIEAAGLKGERLGTAQVSTLHANFIVSDRGNGRAGDVRALGDHVRAVVADRFAVDLGYEIEFVGDWSPRGSP
jgi:UDP-N-acetylmuramate dehydrogenase